MNKAFEISYGGTLRIHVEEGWSKNYLQVGGSTRMWLQEIDITVIAESKRKNLKEYLPPRCGFYHYFVDDFLGEYDMVYAHEFGRIIICACDIREKIKRQISLIGILHEIGHAQIAAESDPETTAIFYEMGIDIENLRKINPEKVSAVLWESKYISECLAWKRAHSIRRDLAQRGIDIAEGLSKEEIKQDIKNSMNQYKKNLQEKGLCMPSMQGRGEE